MADVLKDMYLSTFGASKSSAFSFLPLRPSISGSEVM